MTRTIYNPKSSRPEAYLPPIICSGAARSQHLYYLYAIMISEYIFEIRKDYLYVATAGEYHFSDFMSLPKMILEKCQQENRSKALINLLDLVATDFPTMDRFEIGKEIARVLHADIKLSVAGPQRLINNFAETVAVNRGALMNVVSDLETAEDWLLSDA